jgi:maleate cis-trans isomerase
MYGWRGRIGMLAPSRGDTLLYEFYMLAPDGVFAVPYSCELTHLDRSQLESVRDKYLAGVQKLDRERVDVISVGGTPPQILHGWDGAQKMMASLREQSATPLVGCAESEVYAVKASGAKRVALVTPHGDELNGRLRSVFVEEGVEVASISGLGMANTVDIGMVTESQVYRTVLDAARAAGPIDAVHISCPRWPTMRLLDPLEETLGVPVTSGAQAQLWSSFETVGVSPKAGRWGSLWSHRHPARPMIGD